MSAPIGGQAVLEGVMMRGPSNWAVAVRKPNGQIAEVCRPIESMMKRHWAFRLPIVRGVIALGESLAIGFRALSISANYAAAEDDEEAETELSRGAIVTQILWLPPIAGLAYELIRLAGKHTGNRFVMKLLAPGLWLQRLTTREPTLDQLEVSIRALREVLALEKGDTVGAERVEVMA